MIRLLTYSATYTFDNASNATPVGPLNDAEEPLPSANPKLLPASVDTTPSGVILRILLLLWHRKARLNDK